MRKSLVKMNMERSLSSEEGKKGKEENLREEERSTFVVEQDVVGTSRTSSRKIIFRKVIRQLANLKFAIGEIAFIASLSALGTLLEQNKAPEYYTSQLIEGKPLLSDILGNVVLLFGFDHMYTSPFFLSVCALLTTSLLACSYQTQWPMVKVAQRWRFIEEPKRVLKYPSAHSLRFTKEVTAAAAGGVGGRTQKHKNMIGDVSAVLMSRGYETFVRERQDGGGEALYAFKGLSGKFAPIGVHISMVLVVLGASVSTTCGWHGNVMIQEGEEIPVSQVISPNSVLGRWTNQPGQAPDSEAPINLKLNKFRIDYYPDGKVEQFYSDLSVTEDEDSSSPSIASSSSQEVFNKLISVNNPLRYGALTAYQTDWAISGAQMEVVINAAETETEASSSLGASSSSSGEGTMKNDNGNAVEKEDSFQVPVPMVSLEGRLGEIGGRIWGGVLPVFVDSGVGDNGGLMNITLVARDLQNVAIYDQGGQFKGILRPGSKRSLEVGPVSVRAVGLTSSSGLELKSDPGVPIVYTGFAFLMLTTVLSYVSHSQVWALTTSTQQEEEGKEEGEGDQEGLAVLELVLGGTTNRAKKEFQKEVSGIVKELQEGTSTQLN
jgi:cytochrome c biogenesis protein